MLRILEREGREGGFGEMEERSGCEERSWVSLVVGRLCSVEM